MTLEPSILIGLASGQRLAFSPPMLLKRRVLPGLKIKLLGSAPTDPAVPSKSKVPKTVTSPVPSGVCPADAVELMLSAVMICGEPERIVIPPEKELLLLVKRTRPP